LADTETNQNRKILNRKAIYFYKFTKFEVKEIERLEPLSTKQTKGTCLILFFEGINTHKVNNQAFCKRNLAMDMKQANNFVPS
jgi:hypothetical protein